MFIEIMSADGEVLVHRDCISFLCITSMIVSPNVGWWFTFANIWFIVAKNTFN